MYRPEIGITAFLHHPDATPWSCIFKHNRSDFVVQEIMKDQKICEITDEPQIYLPPDEEEESNANVKPPERFTEEMRKQFEEFRLNNQLNFIVNTENWTKDERKDLHMYVKTFGGLDSETNGNEIKIFKPTRERKRKRALPHDKKFVHFTLSKEDHDTNFAINLMSKLINKNASSFGFSGTKDRRAITAQRVSVYGMDPIRLYKLNERLRGMYISDAVYEQKDLALGSAFGNRFSIALREFNTSENDEQIKTRIDQWEADGFLNYYGDQRFGSWSNSTSEVGRKILQRDWKGAVELILAPVRDQSSQLNVALVKYKETQDPVEAYNLIPGAQKSLAIEGKILKFLSGKPTDFKGALMAITRPVRTMYVHAYQSLVFNKIISRRAEKYGKQVIEGDLFMVNDEFVESGTIENVVLPLICFPSRYPNNEIKDWYSEMLEQDEITKEVFLELKNEFGIGESMRKFIERPRNVSHKLVFYKDTNTVLQHFPPYAKVTKEELSDSKTDETQKQALLLQFDLVSGIYATMSLRELLHYDLGKDNQRGMSKQLKNTDGEEVKE